MNPAPDDRGQANLIGFILLFGFLLTTYSIFQVSVIPNQNAEIEYHHYQDVRSDMTDLYAEIVTPGDADPGLQVLVPIDLGMDYPPRLLFINPPPAAGTIQSTDTEPIKINGANATNICNEEYNTTGIVYSPGYHETTQPDVRFDNGLLYVETADGEFAVLEQRPLLRNGEINLYRLSGRLRPQSGTNTLPLELTDSDTPRNTTQNVPVTNITLPSDLPADAWNNSSALSDGLTAVNATNGVDGVTISNFPDDPPYTVNCQSVGLGQSA
ncbi:hypothetical protein [Halorubrum halophilum]|uniref:hypothetical protein n=1 Tax=Halorubrum halophilum TaxID=413816 RepID=UPI00186AE29E|nr:hypothetical protein [Halorubrum halophilum]